MSFVVQDTLAQLRERKTWLALAMFAYAIGAMPFLMQQPPAHIEEAVATWFGSSDPTALFLYLWTDIAMNKLVAILGVVLGAGLLVGERDKRVLDLLWSKPMPRGRYFVSRVLGACAVMAALFLSAHVLALPWFAAQIAGFDPALFAASAAVQVFSAMFAVVTSATLAVWIGRRTLGAICSLLLLFTLVSMAFLGFYNPDWAPVAGINPFAQAASVVGHVHDLSVARHVLLPIAAILVATVAMGGVGLLGLRRWEV